MKDKPISTAIQCLAAVAQHHGITISPEKLSYDYAFEHREPSIQQFIRMANDNSLRAHHENIDWAGLLSLKGVFPIFAMLDNGNWIIVVGIRWEDQCVRVVLLDPLEPGTDLLLLDSAKFCVQWKGNIIFVEKKSDEEFLLSNNIELSETLKTAIIFHKNDNFQEAFNYYLAVHQNQPKNKLVMYLLGMLLLQNGFKEKGNDLINKSEDYCKPERQHDLFSNIVAEKYCIEIDHINTLKSPSPCPIYDGTTVDQWRHLRMIDFVPCFNDKGSSWLTIGDAYGHDVIRLRHYGVCNVVASNTNTRFLKYGHEAGVINNYLEINAEHINLPDNSFDYVLCKEAIHHMPRAPLAIYEMLRVARKAVFLVEPQDAIIDLPLTMNSLFSYNIDGNSMSIGKVGVNEKIASRLIDNKEEVENYVYTLSKREIIKICYGMGLPGFCWKGLNDHYVENLASQPATPDSDGFKKTLEMINLGNHLCAVTGWPYTILIGIIFKEFPSKELGEKLEALGYTLNRTPSKFLPIQWPDIK